MDVEDGRGTAVDRMLWAANVTEFLAELLVVWANSDVAEFGPKELSNLGEVLQLVSDRTRADVKAVRAGDAL